MLTQEQALAELRQVNRELGLPEDDGVPMTRAQVEAELLRIDQELASTPESFSEFSARRKKEADRSFGEDLSAFGGAFWDGAGMIAEQAGKAWDEKGNVSLNVAKQTLDLGWDDFKRFANTLGGAAMDKLPGVSEEEELRREYARYVTNFEYNTRIRAEKLEKLENRALSDFGANFVDPLLFVPVAGMAAKGGALTAKGLQSVASAGAKAAGSRGLTVASKVAGGTAATLGGVAKVADLAGTASSLPSRFASTVVRKGMKGAALGGSALARAGAKTGELVATAAGAPRKGVAWVAGKLVPASSRDLAGAGAFGGQIVGAMTGAIPGALPLSIAEVSGFIAGRTGRAAQEILRVFAQPSGNSRFLYRLATDSSLSPALRSLALRTYQMGGSKAGDAMFNMLVNGITVGALNGALAYAAGEAAEGIGAAAGAGALMGGVLPIGQPNARGGKSQSARDARSIDNYMKSKIVSDQRKHFNKLPQKSQLMLATMAESGVGAPKVMILPKTEYLEAASGVDSAGFYSPEERIVTVNASRLSEGGEYAVNTIAHEVGHDFVKQSLGDDPAMLRLLLEDFETARDEGEAFYFQYTPDGTPIGDPIYLDETAQQIRTDYDRRIRGAGIGQNASKLAQEIGADQFSMLFSENPNAFEQFHPRLRRRLLDGARRTLSALGMVNAETGNTLTNTISKRLLGNPGIARLYKNYGAARSYELLEKGEATDVGVLVEPARGQTGEDRFQQLFGGVGISLAEGKNLRITDKRLFEELKSIRDRYEDSAPEGWGVTKQGWLAGKKLTDELYTLFTRNDRFGNVANLIDAATEAIAQRIGVRFGYRSGTKGNYQNPFKIRDVGLYGFLISPIRFSGGKNAKRQTRPTLKVVGYDEAKLRHNVEVMVQEGIVKDPKAFLQRLAAHAQEALQDPEGRINPDGRKENEDLTVAFGMKGSTENIASPRLRELLENKKIKDTFVSYDLEAMAGLSKGRNKAFVFDYENIRDNYSPFFYAAGKMPQYLPAAAYHGTPHTFKAEEGAPLGRFRSSQIGTGEGAQAYGHGLYFAGKKEVAEHYRKTLVREENPNKWKEKPGTESFDEQVSFILDDAAIMSKTNAEFLKDLEALETRATSGEYQYSPSEIFYIKKAVSLVKNGDVELAKGSLYKVELAPKENEYLLWDKPLSEHPKKLREKFLGLLRKLNRETYSEFALYDHAARASKYDMNGVSLYGTVKRFFEGNPSKASAALKEAGIPGIKYLDGSSRSKGKGDYNYVIFDEADVAITDKLFMPALDDARLKSLEGDKNAVQADLTIADYPANPNPDSVALPARMGLVNPKVAGMPKTYNEVRKMITDQVDRIIAVAKKFPGFAKRAANFYGDMAESALLMADAAMVKGRSIFDVADLQLRFLALGSPRSSVPANTSKSARSMAAAGGELAGHKINPGDQQTAANSTARAWDDGGHFDPSLKGVDDKVRNFYLNGIAELIDKAKRQGTPEDVQMLQQRAAYTLGFLKPGQDMSPQTLTKLEGFLDGLATVDMWDMAGKGYAHPAYVKRGKGRGQNADAAFQWSVPKHAENRTMSGDIWRQAMEDMGIESPMDLDYRQARALMVDGRKDWNADTWAERVKEGFDGDTKWVSFSKADEGGLNPGGGGPLYDAHQTIDGLIADELNAQGLAEAFGKTKLVARNAQEILWAIEKLDNPVPANQKLVLFGDRIKPFFDAIQYLRLEGETGYLPPAAQSILTAIRDTYAKSSSQSIPLEIVTQGQSRRAATVQRQEAALGDTVLTEAVASGLLDDLQRVADLHEVPIVVDEVKVGRGGYEEDGNAAVAPNVVISLRGDPAHTGKVMEALSFSVDQDGGNLIRKPTIEELNNPKTELNNAIVFNTNHLQPDQLSAFFLDLAALKDKQGNSFLTGFTQTKDGMFIGDQFYGGDMVAEAAAQSSKIEQIMAKYGVVEDKFETVVIETFHRLNREPAAQHVFHRHAREILGNPFTRDLHRLLQDRVKNASQEKAGGLPQARQGTRRVMQRAQEAVEREYGSAGSRSSVMDALLADVDLMLLRGEVDSDGAGALKGQVKELFKATPFRKAHRSQAKKLKRAVDKVRRDAVYKEVKKKGKIERVHVKQPEKKRKAALWSQRGEYSPAGKWEPAGPGQFARKVQQLMTKGQKSIDLLPSGSREKTGVQLPARFQKDPTRTGKWRKK